ncbi:chemotaxis protein CheX [Kineothrix sp. MB12-C1]|uniref:chemotaxis protein CheX n=1 Tax=Kineothrix sp. MB12-C1 TaxID=3070215 RepID=UPI0027D34E8C|nr:chemotaxis protein CheX [Kineothrix sp. MB12-C1]WMC91481.1 chemotaxis protein CheX [Kineothrix sp. MB12-C1]
MADKLYKPFLEATRNVFQLMLDMSDLHELTSEDTPYEDGLDISIGIVGEMEGEVVYHFPVHTSLGMVNIMSGLEMETVDEFVISAVSEIANIISGNVLTMFAETDVKCDILTPKLCKVSGDRDEYTTCRIQTPAGEVCLDILLKPAA